MAKTAGSGRREAATSVTRCGKLRKVRAEGLSGFGDCRDAKDLGVNDFHRMERESCFRVRDARAMRLGAPQGAGRGTTRV